MLTNTTDYYKSSQTKEKTKWNQLNWIKEIKSLFEKCFKPTWHRKMFFLIFCYNLASYQNKKVAIIELRNENE